MRKGSVLAISSASPAEAQIADGRVDFALSDVDGAIVRRGRLPAPLAAEILLIADYGLLSHAEVLRLEVPRTDLIAPSDDPDASAECSPDAVLRAWMGEEHHATLLDTDRHDLRTHLRLRSITLEARLRSLEQITAHLDSVSAQYRALFETEQGIPRSLLRLLRDYPGPHSLDDKGIVALAQAIDRTSPVALSVVDRLLTIVRRPLSQEAARQAELAEALLPGAIDLYFAFDRQLRALDRSIYLAALQKPGGGDAEPSALPKNGDAPFSLFSLSSLPAPLAHGRDGSMSEDPAQAIRVIDALYARRLTQDRVPNSDYESYAATRAALDLSTLDAEDALRLEIIGQHLALGADRFFDAIRHRTACDRLLSAATAALSGRARADAELSLAITEVCAVDLVQGFSSLRSAIESGRTAAASPELLSEALGLLAFIIVLFGEYLSYPEALHAANTRAREHGACGAARAPADLTELFLIVCRPDAGEAEFEAARRQADQSSLDTVYRSFYHYVMMLSTYTTKDVELGLHHYTQIKHLGVWARFNRRFDRLSALSYAIHLAARGDFATCRHELGAAEAPYGSIGDGAAFLIQGLFGLRLDLAVGRHQSVLAATKPDGALGELSIQNVHLRRYAPTSLLLRGTALMREGQREAAIDCFERATQQSVRGQEWLALLAAETAEYREWLESLDPDDPEGLPGDLTPELLSAILARPTLIRHTLEPLTSQQTRILGLLAQERSAASIAAELHISGNTLKTHMRQLYQRLGVRSREQAVLKAESYGLL